MALLPFGSAPGVRGPSSATDNAIARFDATTGKLIQNSGLILDDSNVLTWGGDTNLYRSAANTLKTDDSFIATGTITGSNLSGTNTGDQDLSGYVTAASTLTDNYLMRGDGGVRGVQNGFWSQADTGEMTSSQTVTIPANYIGGFFFQWDRKDMYFTGTQTVGTNGNLGGSTILYADHIIRYGTTQALAGVSIFDGRPTIQPTAGVTDSAANVAWRTYFSAISFAPDLSTAVTATTGSFGSFYSSPQVGVKAGSHASAAAVVPVLFGYYSQFSVAAQGTATVGRHFWASNAFVSGTVTTQVGLQLDSMTSATNNTGIVIGTATTGNWGIYQSTTTDNYFGGSITAANGITFADAKNIVFNTTTGTKIGTATGQKLGFWNATPVIQPTTAVTAATFAANTSGIVDDSATWDGYTIGQVVKALRNIGALA